ncbi:MAG: hypothetical protein KKC39_02785 [Candidatus Omnitrophica bacterium]|nr:hypothetical protein [Candidatus Omnitrophota bacterium]MBU4467656.1 hypothetical protein [Candidatus Omnitrophota bacterium]MCG2707480.1 hypothetical protein [Candidatus Omnitrophota bacterium]
MGTPKWIKPFFVVAGLYDGILGLLFLLVPYQLFKAANVPPPNHVGYVQFPALLLVIFAIMFFNIAKNPLANRSLILYGILLKISYSGVVLFHWFSVNIPPMWVVFAFLDLGFLALFIVARRALGKQS